ncbi:MAG: transposase [Deltaproteobacteria bacterium]|nr:transposase [Deltaproteobacteria bacterium]
MQFRVVRTAYKGTVRQYGQIVESFRRPGDGMPTHRVVGNLGPVTDQQAATFKAAFTAARSGRQLTAVADIVPPTVAWTRSLVDVCAVLHTLDACGLRQMLRELFAGHDDDVDPADVVAALVAQRCVAADSKLAACRWLPGTMLPELLGLAPAKFHNTRVHRVLERLEAAEADLQAALAGRLLAADGAACRAYFIDCTDTWFVGNGPAMARRGKTKEGLYRAKVGIVLLCRQDGIPLRFEVVQGNSDEGRTMLALLRSLRVEPWLGGAPVVCDRALGNTSDLLEFIDMDLQFVTALVASEHAAYGAVVDCPALGGIDPEDPNCLDVAGEAVVAVGMTRHADNLYVLQRPPVRRGEADRQAVIKALGSRTRPPRLRGYDLARDMLVLARKYRQAVQGGEVASYAALQRGLGCSNGQMHRYLSMLKLPDHVQEQILAGRGRNLNKKAIVRICEGSDHEAHGRAFALACAEAVGKRADNGMQPRAPRDAGNPWLQVMTVFNPLMWRAKRRRAARRLAKVQARLDRLNAQVAAGQLQSRAAAKLLHRVLTRFKLDRFYGEIATDTADGVPLLRLTLDHAKWHKARARDGFHVVVASPDLDMAPADLVRLYRSKDAVERDFKEIKSVLELRPVRHRTDVKVRAHVALCVLALAVQRTMEARLSAAGRTESAASALEELANVRAAGLRLAGAVDVLTAPSEATVNQRALASALSVVWALDPAELRKRIVAVR